MLNNNEHMNTLEYLRGKHDCKENKPAEVAATEDYERGYGDEYSVRESLTAMGLIQDNKMSIFG